MDQPCLWEGLFRVACLIKSKPMEEPVTAKILEGTGDEGNGAFAGSIHEQVCRARAAFAVYEYNTDRTILKRIALWLRYVEIEFDTLRLQDQLLYRPADMMELLIRFYRATGSKAVLRLCSRLRAEAFDWTTALHTFQQSIPIRKNQKESGAFRLPPCPVDLDYDEKQTLVNHAEMLADGVRYTLYTGLFSGNGQDLSAGRSAWSYLSRHHRALCGGTTSDPFLCGCGSDQPVGTASVAAWTEAFSSQLTTDNAEWALDELIRIVFNALYDCISREELTCSQYVNTCNEKNDIPNQPAALYARITRAAADAFSHAVTITEEGIRINYFLSARYLLMIRRQPVVLYMKQDSGTFRCDKPFFAPVDFFCSKSSDNEILISRNGTDTPRKKKSDRSLNGFFIHTEGEWKDLDSFRTEQSDRIICENTHHQGICFLYDNCLLSVPASAGHYAFSVSEPPNLSNGEKSILLKKVSCWKEENGLPYDIPVLPKAGKESVLSEIRPYHEVKCRITMFPRTGTVCLK